MLPGTVAVVEDDDEVEATPRGPARRLPPRRRKRPITQAEPSKTITPVEVEQPSEVPGGSNDLLDFVFPAEDTPMEAALEMLVRDIDLALQRDLEVTAIRDDVVAKFPPHIVGLLVNTDADTLVSVLDTKAPATWRINSLDGQKKVRELHALLASG